MNHSKGRYLIFWGTGLIVGAILWHLGVVLGWLDFDSVKIRNLQFPQLSPITWALAILGTLILCAGIILREKEIKMIKNRRITRDQVRRALRWNS